MFSGTFCSLDEAVHVLLLFPRDLVAFLNRGGMLLSERVAVYASGTSVIPLFLL